jgi:hypothetical protein
VQSWLDRQTDLARMAERQLFFVGGAPRSGTTWIQRILDAHPEVSCRGEGFFLNQLAVPLDAMMVARSKVLTAKNTTLFQSTGGFPLPASADTEHLAGTAILLALQQQMGTEACRAVGEKTPENVFFFQRLKQLFPGAKFIGVARDPRDVLTSAWHLFQKVPAGADEVAAKTNFLKAAFPSLAEGARVMLDLTRRFPDDAVIVTYEAMVRDPVPLVARLFRLLGVPDDPAIVATCLERTSFAAATGGRPAGVEDRGAFYRKGVVGDWRSTLTPEMNRLILQELGWTFPLFGWEA